MIVEMALMVALLASLIVNYVLVDQLRKAEKKMEEWEDERKW
jgi:hypothetical protein